MMNKISRELLEKAWVENPFSKMSQVHFEIVLDRYTLFLESPLDLPTDVYRMFMAFCAYAFEDEVNG